MKPAYITISTYLYICTVSNIAMDTSLANDLQVDLELRGAGHWEGGLAVCRGSGQPVWSALCNLFTSGSHLPEIGKLLSKSNFN
jgi:hypothetical protein